ncbi:phage regulatory CII family protein [Coraliomargarita algicola]|uniref:Phage regulatory CII family protein n=1 Tax=Coraliomargarita algicola TaxID=3092156 RepID=A0ABZ0RSG7_9BACT|nr:phage regulatory CII family protein [Coraliomargarita sp. J2-16]WPJ98113.1 phage regulatory CII family protein [Coraliomargarita sp. J2-16]
MQSHEIIKTCFANSSPKALAAELGISQSLIYKWSQPVGESQSGSKNPLDRVCALNQACSDNQLIKWLAAQADGYFVPNKVVHSELDALNPATHEMVSQFASLLGAIAHAGLDERITREEAADIRQRWDTLKSFADGFVNACERGDFDKMKEIEKQWQQSS